MKKLLALAFFSLTASAAQLETPNYLIDITVACAEGNISCDRVVYEGRSKESGRTITLDGRTWHTRCADGATPCRFLGYRFDNGDTTYYVHEDGRLQVIRGCDDVLVNEQGTWRY
ncbi:hypothetical protein SSPSH_003710 [Salinisphaera shabanensis E1L3A]|uniref:Uncharacterized protein n=1 Tax=Salinisphaera shabanensis E1L3A TaxID=1033802 RepID=U2FST4_9GAMM|nr:hypothetical protein [Salinisphaera shabanensis]ERJ17498.1 hypothetical protein SSPSH_003710 [Salinisphaera shabanensis E1L3A]